MPEPHHRGEMLTRLERLLDAQAARAGHAARERIDLLLDRDSPFLELAPLAEGAAVVGIGIVEGAVCVVACAGTDRVDPLDPKVRRAMAHAGDCALPALILDDLSGDHEAIRHQRQRVRWEHRATTLPAPPAEPPRADADALLDVPDPPDIVRHVVDGSRIDERSRAPEPSTIDGWATIGGLPICVAAGTAPPRHPPLEGAVPVLRVTTTPVPGSAPEVSVSVTAGPRGFSFSWPGPQLPGATDDDGVIDPRDTRIVLGIARWCLEPRPSRGEPTGR